MAAAATEAAAAHGLSVMMTAVPDIKLHKPDVGVSVCVI
jgi:hypothetical protein